MDDQSAAVVATHAASLFNALEAADGEIGEELLDAVAGELEGTSWCVEHVGGLWQARPDEGDESEEEDAEG